MTDQHADLQKGEAFAVSDACFAECKLVAEFVDNTVRIPVESAAPGLHGGLHLKGLLLRSTGWMRTLGKLCHPGDFQAVVAGARTLFEIAIDTALLNGDRNAYPIAKMAAWESSAKLDHVEKVKKYLAEKGRTPTERQAVMLELLKREGPSIREKRARYWINRKKKPYHPVRWTAKTLAEDAEAADRFKGQGFEEFHKIRYPQLCWNVHGSGLTGVMNISPELFPFVGGEARRQQANLLLR